MVSDASPEPQNFINHDKLYNKIKLPYMGGSPQKDDRGMLDES